jgi:hypothetical protein
VWLGDHLGDPSRPDLPWFDAWTALAGLAQATSTVRLGPLVTSITCRHPVTLAKSARRLTRSVVAVWSWALARPDESETRLWPVYPRRVVAQSTG